MVCDAGALLTAFSTIIIVGKLAYLESAGLAEVALMMKRGNDTANRLALCEQHTHTHTRYIHTMFACLR